MIHTFSRVNGIALLAIGVLAGMVPALQGTLLYQMQTEGLVSQTEIGRIAMAEALGMLVAVSLAIARLKPEGLKLYVVVAAVIGVLLDLATARLSGGSILAARFVHGACSGILLWVWMGFVTRSDNPGRWLAIYVTAQAAILMVLSAWFADLLPARGANAGFVVLSAFYGFMGFLALFIVPRYEPLGEAGASVIPDLKGLIGLFSVFFHLAAILAMWVYLKPFGKQIGLDDGTTGFAVSVAMGTQIAAGLAATALAGRARAAQMIVLSCVVSIVALLALAFARDAVPFIAATAVFAFMWMFGPPFQMPYLIEIDPSRRAAMSLVTAQLLGVAAGPALASLAVTDQDVTGAVFVSIALFALGAGVVVATAMRRVPAPA